MNVLTFDIAYNKYSCTYTSLNDEGIFLHFCSIVWNKEVIKEKRVPCETYLSHNYFLE
jgi:hypothetical protein